MFTLVTADELKPFKSMLRRCDNKFVRPFFIPPKRLHDMLPRYEVWLGLGLGSESPALMARMRIRIRRAAPESAYDESGPCPTL